MQKVLITGATGFVGRSLVSTMSGYDVVAAVRKRSDQLPDQVQQYDGMELGPNTQWSEALQGVSHIVHLAGVVPGVYSAAEEEAAFQRVNVEGTLNLARHAVSAGVQRFIFISSIGVNGSITDFPFTHFNAPQPHNAYAHSKYQAELGLQELLKDTGTELVVIRPPLIYGRHVSGKFRQLLAISSKGLPLPLGAINNRRSYVFLENLTDLIKCCLTHPAAANQTFLASDGNDISTTELLRMLAASLGKPSRLMPVPVWALRFPAKLLGKEALIDSLCGNLELDISHTTHTLDWAPPVSVSRALLETADSFLLNRERGTNTAGKQEPTKLLRLFDILLSLFGLVVGLPVLLALLVLGYFDTGSPLFRQERVGRNQQPFTLVKFRTMRPDTASVASHLADQSAITPLGRFMRKTKLDELPQLWNVLKGEMSLVGPRPGLFNQEELTTERDEQGIFSVRPGITGLAQVNNVDMSTPKLLAETDRKMLDSLSAANYFKYIVMTVTGGGTGDAVDRS